MSEKKGKIVEIIEEKQEESQATPQLAFPNRAFGLAKDLDGNWKVVSIGYDFSGNTGDFKIEESLDNRMTGIEAFKIKVARSPIINLSA